MFSNICIYQPNNLPHVFNELNCIIWVLFVWLGELMNTND